MRPPRPHIAIVIANLPAERDRRVIRECLTLEEEGYEVTVIAPRGRKGLRTLPGSRGTRLRPYPVWVYGSGLLSFALEFVSSFLFVAARLTVEVLRGRAHAVQVCNPPDVYWPLAMVYRFLLRRPWVFDHHDLCPEIYATRSGGSPNRSAYRMLVAMERLTLRHSSAVFATNRSFVENATARGVPADKVTVVRNGPKRDEIAAAGPDAPGGDGVQRLVYVGVIGPQDSVDVAVLAAEELTRLRGRTGWKLVIAGDGEMLPALKKMVCEKSLGDVVEFPGWLDGPGVDALLRSGTIAIQPDQPSAMNDRSTMAKTVEYVARGLPVVAADLTETRRTAEDAAVYVPTGAPSEFAKAIDALLDDPERRGQMRATGLARFTELLSWEHQAQAYTSVWNRLLSHRRPPVVPRPRVEGAPSTSQPVTR